MARAKIDELELIRLINSRKPDGRPYTQEEMAKKLGVTRVAVHRRMKALDPELIKTRGTAEFREAKADLLSDLQQTILKAITPQKIQKASAPQLVRTMETLDKMERLERGLATENHAHLHKTENLPPEVRKMLMDAVQQLTQKRLTEAREQDLNDNY